MHETQNRDVNKIQNSIIHNEDIEWQQGEKKLNTFFKDILNLVIIYHLTILHFWKKKQIKSFGIFQLWDLVWLLTLYVVKSTYSVVNSTLAVNRKHALPDLKNTLEIYPQMI